MKRLTLSWRLLWRNWRAGEMKILAVALLLAVTVVAGISIFTDRLQSAITRESHSFLAADRVINSSQPIAPEWRSLADQYRLQYAYTTQFASMVFAGDAMQLAAVKAVTDGYPLRGKLRISTQPFTTDTQQISVATGIPAAGEAWVDARLLPLLGISLGATVEVGEQPLRITRVIVEEPDGGNSFSPMGPRLLMNAADLQATGVIQPGSRISYNWLLAADDPQQLQGFLQQITPELSVHERIRDVASSQRRLANALGTARKFLSLSAMISVLLAGVAIAIAARRFASRHVEQVALLKSLGAGAGQIRGLYGAQLLWLGVITSLLGLVLGYGLQAMIVRLVGDLLPVTLLDPGWLALVPPALTGLVCLLCFAAPPLWHLPTVPPMKILRRELPVSAVRQYWQVLIGLLALLLLVAVFSRDWVLTLSLSTGLVVLVALGLLLAQLLLSWVQRYGNKSGNRWRLALASLQRNRQQTLIQTVVFALAVSLLLSLTGLRTSLLQDWQLQLPPETPNHFLLNVAPHQLNSVQQLMSDSQLTTEQFFPMVRGRLTHINGTEPGEEQRERTETLRRELNLSWTDHLNSDNKVIAGQWWDSWPAAGRVGVSVEQEAARQIGLQVGDQLRFSIGGLTLDATVASIRSLKWDSMNPNFYFLFSPQALDEFAPAYMTSFYIPPQQKAFINTLLRFDPTLVVIEMDRMLAQIQAIVNQVSRGVELMLLAVLAAGFLVMWAAVTSSFGERQQEAALLRALGSSRKQLLGSLWLEFSLLGLMSGIMAVAASEVLLLAMQRWVLEIPVRWHPGLWLWGVSASVLLIGAMGVFACRRTITTPPAVILRELT